MIKLGKSVITTSATLISLMVAPAFTAQTGSPIPYGGYRKDGNCGCYGAKAGVKTAAEARKIIEAFLVGHAMRIGVIEERPRFFRAELVDDNGEARDIVVVDRLNGRVRSIK